MKDMFICCKDCKRRVLGCHSECADYKAAKILNEQKHAEIKKQKIISGDFVYMDDDFIPMDDTSKKEKNG